MVLPPDAKQLPQWVLDAVSVVYDELHFDLWSWQPHERTAVLIAALDAEPHGRYMFEAAVFDAARLVLLNRERAEERRRNRRRGTR